jgi:hypothetical protein
VVDGFELEEVLGGLDPRSSGDVDRKLPQGPGTRFVGKAQPNLARQHRTAQVDIDIPLFERVLGVRVAKRSRGRRRAGTRRRGIAASLPYAPLDFAAPLGVSTGVEKLRSWIASDCVSSVARTRRLLVEIAAAASPGRMGCGRFRPSVLKASPSKVVAKRKSSVPKTTRIGTLSKLVTARGRITISASSSTCTLRGSTTTRGDPFPGV